MVAALASLFLPIDGLYIYAINLGLGILSFIFILVASCVKREKRFVLLLFLQLVLLFVWYVLITCRYNPYRIGWKFYLCFMISPIAFSHFFLAKQIFQNTKRVLRCFVALLAFIFVKVVFFTYFYEFDGYKYDGEDIRDYYSEYGKYKVLNRRKLKTKNPEKLNDEDFIAIASLINNSDWLKDNYPECVADFPDDVDLPYIKKNIKYSFSVINFYGYLKADFYKISIPLKNTREKINIYFPKGIFDFYDEEVELYKKYYSVPPEETNPFRHEGLWIPYNQEKYDSDIDNSWYK